MFNQIDDLSSRLCDVVSTVSWQCFGSILRDSERNHPRHMTTQCGLVRESQLQDFACVQWRKQRDISVRFMREVCLRESRGAAGGNIQRPSTVEGHHWRKSDFGFAIALKWITLHMDWLLPSVCATTHRHNTGQWFVTDVRRVTAPSASCCFHHLTLTSDCKLSVSLQTWQSANKR